jgi:hypothetical protein
METPSFIEKRGTKYYFVLDALATYISPESKELGLCFINFITIFSALLTTMTYFKDGVEVVPIRVVGVDGSGTATQTELRLYRHFSLNSMTVNTATYADTVGGLLRKFNRTNFPGTIEISEAIFGAILSQFPAVTASTPSELTYLTPTLVSTFWSRYETALELGHVFAVVDGGALTPIQVTQTAQA